MRNVKENAFREPNKNLSTPACHLMFIGQRVHPQPVQQRAVALNIRVAGGQQAVTVEHGVGASEETQRLHRVAHLLPSGG